MAERTCSVGGCPYRAKTRGWCSTHYKRWLRSGSLDDPRKEKGPCSHPDCDRTSASRGLCQRHYDQWRHRQKMAARPLAPRRVRTKQKFRIDPASGCWNWLLKKNKGGYATMRHGGRILLAHRVFIEVTSGQPIPAGLEVDHLCRNRGCVNPAHLEVVTPAENQRRMWEARRAAMPTHCKRGHEFTEENTRIRFRDGGSYRLCRRCAALGRSRAA